MNIFNNIKEKVSKVTEKVSDLLKEKKVYQIKGKNYNEEKLLAEGGFGYVYLVSDQNGKLYAMKKINIQESSQLQIIKQEINIWALLNKSNNIITLLDYELSQSHALILMEYSSEGNLFNKINSEFVEKNTYIKESEALEIFKQILSGVHHIHSTKHNGKIIQHRDIKIENLLKVGKYWKLCDFGSASTDILDPSRTDKNTLKLEFSKYEKTTTFCYRPPEMVDEYSGFLVNEKVDIWMLGCTLFTLLYKRHPFIDAQKGSIIKADYYFPVKGIFSDKIDDLIRLMLTQNPKERPDTNTLIKILDNWNNAQINLPPDTLEIKIRQLEATGGKDFKTNQSGFKPISPEEFYAAQKAILDKTKNKQTKYKKRG